MTDRCQTWFQTQKIFISIPAAPQNYTSRRMGTLKTHPPFGKRFFLGQIDIRSNGTEDKSTSFIGSLFVWTQHWFGSNSTVDKSTILIGSLCVDATLTWHVLHCFTMSSVRLFILEIKLCCVAVALSWRHQDVLYEPNQSLAFVKTKAKQFLFHGKLKIFVTI